MTWAFSFVSVIPLLYTPVAVKLILRRFAFVFALTLAFGCGGGKGGGTVAPTSPSATAPVPTPAPTPAGPELPAAPPVCEAWPTALEDLLRRLPLPSNLCFIREASPLASEYRPVGRRVIYRNPAPASGEIGSITHELCHARQHRVILDAGGTEINVGDQGDWLVSNWARTSEGAEYLESAGYTYLGPSATCTRSVQAGCWKQDPASAEMGFTLSSYGNPLEDNAQFCAVWYNPGNLSMWSRVEVARLAPKRVAWAQKYLQ